MSAEFVALIVGTVLAVGAVSFVLYPLFFGTPVNLRRSRQPRSDGESAIVALREIEFDKATGKLSDADYAELRRMYAERALAEMRRADPEKAASVDDIEARVLAYRTSHRECKTCGLRPEDDAIYCSTCGAYLDEMCPTCKTRVPEFGATFCSHCGAHLPRVTATA